MPNYLYHWTHRSNLRSIVKTGLDPKRATGRKQRVWACTERAVGWALGHVAAHHDWDEDDMILIHIEVGKSAWKRTPWRHVYTCAHNVSPDHMTDVKFKIIGPWTALPRIDRG